MDKCVKQTALALLPFFLTTMLGACGRKPEGGPKVKALPASGFRLEWVGPPNAPARVPARYAFPVTVTVKNVSDQVWQDPRSSDATPYAAGSVRLGYRWRKGAESPAPNAGYADARADLLAPLGPGASTSLTVQVTAPAQPGDYVLQLDLCQELVSWFEAKGAAPLIAPVHVE